MTHTIDQGLSFVIPFYNEEGNVIPVIDEINAALAAEYPIEIIAVDDASTDNTLKKLQELKQRCDNLVIVRHKKNMGKSSALVTGINAAQYDWISTFDGDGQNNPKDMIQVIAAVKEAQLRLGHSRILCSGKRRKRNDTWLRKLSTKVANKVRNFFLKDNCLDSGCGIKVFTKALFLSLPHFQHCHRFIAALFKCANAEIINVPVEDRKRISGLSKYGLKNRLWVGIVDLFGVAWLMRRSVYVEIEEDASL